MNPNDSDWKKGIRLHKGKAMSDVDNLAYILENDPLLHGTVRKNEFTGMSEPMPDLPFKASSRIWNDESQALLARYLAKEYGLSHCSQDLNTAVLAVASENRYHPVRDYLDGLPEWDKVQRVETLLIDYLGAIDTPYCRSVTSRWMASAIARIYEPGFKMDSLLLVSGRQGIGKSSLFSKLAVKPEWYTDDIGLSMDTKDSAERIRGRWIIEISELSALKRSEVESIKAFLSRQADKYRPAYGRFVSSFERQCIFCATTNEDSFLRDETGNRRFWCVEAYGKGNKSIWDDLPKELDQIWAEAKEIYLAHQGDGSWFNGSDIASTVEMEASRFKEVDPWKALIGEWLERSLPSNWYSYSLEERRDYFDPDAPGLHGTSYDEEVIKRSKVCPEEILNECLQKPKGQQASLDIRRVNKIMSNMEGWEKVAATNFPGYGKARGFQRIKSATKDGLIDGG